MLGRDLKISIVGQRNGQPYIKYGSKYAVYGFAYGGQAPGPSISSEQFLVCKIAE